MSIAPTVVPLGCSPVKYGPSIPRLATSLTLTVSTIDAIDTRLTADRQSTVQAALLDNSVQLRSEDDASARDAVGCVLSVELHDVSLAETMASIEDVSIKQVNSDLDETPRRPAWIDDYAEDAETIPKGLTKIVGI